MAKFTDEQIKKAKSHFKYGIECDIFQEPVLTHAKIALDAIDLFKRQEAEIERLRGILNTRCEHCPRDNKTLVEEFAEEVIDLIYEADDVNPIDEWQVRNLVKEMVGESNAQPH